jgi:two-component system catabolic regulation response regulator CreB/two-component system response regulator ChvI
MASRKLLIVDDEVDVLSTLTAGLEQWGFNVDAYNDPLAALSNFKPKLYEVAILDFRMPNMNGFELYRQLKRIDPSLRVCFLTAFDLYRKEFQTMFPDIKAEAIFRKPVVISELARQLDKVLDSRAEVT